jgi:hypothetical protein
LNALSDFASSFTAEVQEKKEQIAMAEALLDGLREKTWAAVAAN